MGDLENQSGRLKNKLTFPFLLGPLFACSVHMYMLKVCSDYTYCCAPLRPFSPPPPPSTTWQRKEKSNTVEQPGITHKREKEKASRQPEAAPPSNLMLIPGAEERKEEAFSRSHSDGYESKNYESSLVESARLRIESNRISNRIRSMQ